MGPTHTFYAFLLIAGAAVQNALATCYPGDPGCTTPNNGKSFDIIKFHATFLQGGNCIGITDPTFAVTGIAGGEFGRCCAWAVEAAG